MLVGVRPNRRAQDAIAEIHFLASHGYEWVAEADIRACFDSIEHTPLTDRMRRRISDRRVLALVEAFLKAGVMTQTGDREQRLTGTPQGGILSPLLVNIALSAPSEHVDVHRRQQIGTSGPRADARAWARSPSTRASTSSASPFAEDQSEELRRRRCTRCRPRRLSRRSRTECPAAREDRPGGRAWPKY